jgi:catechol 2,3-dioxygenase-like lactoylglutathione lyase family enzyme
MASLPTLNDDGIALTHFIVAADVDRAARFYSDVLGGEIVLAGEPTVVALANSWIIITVGGGPTDDRPNVILEPPQCDPESPLDTSPGVRPAAMAGSERPGGRPAPHPPPARASHWRGAQLGRGRGTS